MPVLRTVLPTVGKTLGLSALAGLASEGASQLVKKITGGQIFRVPNEDLHRLAMLRSLLTKGHIRDSQSSSGWYRHVIPAYTRPSR